MQTVKTKLRHICSVSTLFAYRNFYGKCSKNKKIPPETPKTRNGLVQMIRMDKSTGHKRAKLHFSMDILSMRSYKYCMAHQCSPLGRKFMECYIIKPAQSLLMKHLVIGQLISRLFIGHHTVIWSAFRNHQGSTFTEKDRNKLNCRIGPLR